MDMHMDGAWDIFWIKSRNGTFIALQMKSFGQKKSNFMHELKSAILAILQKSADWPCLVSAAIQNGFFSLFSFDSTIDWRIYLILFLERLQPFNPQSLLPPMN